MKIFTIIRMKKTGASIHKVWVNSKQHALELCWPDEAQVIGKFVTDGEVTLSSV